MTQGNGPIQVVSKLWGREEILANSEYCLKRLVLSAGYSSSLHWHRVKDETFVIQSGECWLQVMHNERRLNVGDWVRIQPGVQHRFWNESMYECVILEVSTHHDDGDVVRIKDSHKLLEEDAP